MIKAILFDFNQTLIHSPEWMALETRALPRAAFSLLHHSGHFPRITDAQLSIAEHVFRNARKTANTTNRETSHVTDLQNMIESLDLGLTVPKTIVSKTVDSLHRDCISTVHLLPHTKRTIEDLDALGIRMGIISNAAYGPFLRWTLDHFGLLEFFEDVVISAEVRIRKPALEIFQSTLHRMRLTPNDAVYIGDDFQKDIVPSKKLGMRAIWRKPAIGLSVPETGTTADAVITNNKEIPALAKKWILS